jgi:hypothetical protein
VAVGGTWPGSPDVSRPFPQQVVIDYVHVHAQRSHAEGSGGGGNAGTITGIGGECVDVSGANSADGTAIQLRSCDGTGRQWWSHAALRSSSGRYVPACKRRHAPSGKGP